MEQPPGIAIEQLIAFALHIKQLLHNPLADEADARDYAKRWLKTGGKEPDLSKTNLKEYGSS